jgi:hypothetical protein
LASGDRLFVSFESPPSHRYFVSAWMFLEDAVARATKEANPLKRVFHLQRLLGPCATNLRMACEAHFGDLAAVPEPRLMWFLTAARHVSAHPVNEPGRGMVQAAHLQWNNASNKGIIETEIVMDIDLSASKLKPEFQLLAKEYLAGHGNDLFLALHAAAQAVALWVGEKVDEDFHALRRSSVGRFTMRVPVDDAKSWRDALDELTKPDSNQPSPQDSPDQGVDSKT